MKTVKIEPNTSYRPPFYLGQTFVDGKKRVFEIIETHWGLPIPAPEAKQISSVIELQNGHKIIFKGPPHACELQKVGFRLLDSPNSPINRHRIQTMSELLDQRKIVMLLK